MEARFQGGGVVPCQYIDTTRKAIECATTVLSNSANCTVLRADVLTQYWRVTDRRTDGQTDRQTDGTLAMRALRRAVKTKFLNDSDFIIRMLYKYSH